MSEPEKTVSESAEIPLFLLKLWAILSESEEKENQGIDTYINWTPEGTAFAITDVNKFTQTILPKYFKHNNFCSFVRQLNMYGFNKVRQSECDNVYANANFIRNRKDLLSGIKRKIRNREKLDKIAVYHPESDGIEKDIAHLKARQIGLETMCKKLIEQNDQILRENEILINKLAEQQEERNKKMEQLLISLIMARGPQQLALPFSEKSRILSLENDPASELKKKLSMFQDFLENGNGVEILQKAIQRMQEGPTMRKTKSNTFGSTLPHNNLKKSRSSIEPLGENQDESLISLGDFLANDSNNLPQKTFI